MIFVKFFVGKQGDGFMRKVLMTLKDLWGNKKHKKLLRLGVVITVSICISLGYCFSSYSNTVNSSLSDNLIRLHVVANSDSPEDQALKRDVRDVILEYMKQNLSDSKSIEETRLIINKNMKTIEQLAKDEIKRQKKVYDVKVSLGNYPFPIKMYGDITLPSGYYQALKVNIGKAEGANWWCVLFPPLCFVDATHGTVPDSVKQDLKNVLSEEEYNIITANDEDIPVKVRFKTVDFFQGSKVKIDGMVSRFFN